MKNKLILKCSDQFETADWVLLAPNGSMLQNKENTPLSDLKKVMNLSHCNITVLIASSQILIRKITIPPKIGQGTLTKIIPNILEEDLISNIEAIHFSYVKTPEESTTEKTINVALVEHEILKNWIEKLKTYDIEPQSMYPLCLAMHAQQEEWGIWFENSFAVVSTGAQAGFVIESALLPTLLQAFYNKSKTKPKHIKVYTTKSTTQNIHFEDHAELSKIMRNHSKSVWEVFNKDSKSINLLHSDFVKEQFLAKCRPYLIHGIGLLLFCFVVALVVDVTNIITLNRINSEQEQQIAKIYQELYPQAKSIVSPQRRMESEIKTFSKTSGGTFYELLYVAGSALTKHETITLKNLAYKNGQLDITVEANNYPDIEKLLIALKTKNIIVSQKRTELQKDKVNAVIVLQQGGAS